MRRLLLSIFGAITLSISTSVFADADTVERLPPESFGQCQFSLMETKHIKLEAESDGSSRYSYCHISLSIPPNMSGEPLDITILARTIYESELKSKMKDGVTENGFVLEKNGKWLFRGTEFLLPPTKILSTSLIEENIDGEIVLVGHQLLSGHISQGGPLKVPGIRIVRITPNFAIRVSLNFHSIDNESIAKKRLREAVSKEIIDVVKSVHYRPGMRGPTVQDDRSPN